MGWGKKATGLLFLAVVLNLGWLWIPLGVAALVAATWGSHLLVDDRWPRWLEAIVFFVAWAPFLYLVAASGLTVGVGDRQLFSVGGVVRADLLRALAGVVVPLLVAGHLRAWRSGRVRQLATWSLVVWLIAVPATVGLEAVFGADVMDAPDPEALQDASLGVRLLVVLPALVAYGLVTAAAGMAWWADRQGLPPPDQRGTGAG